MHIAIIGSGISGLSCAWLLSAAHEVTVYEEAGWYGGHANTRDVDLPGGTVPVDTGFLVYNEPSYPNFTAFMDHLDVATEASDMSFAVSLDRGRLEYNGTDLSGLFAQKRNVVRPRYWTMLRDILRFYRQGREYLATGSVPDVSLGEHLSAQGYSQGFIRDHLLPMGAAIWSVPSDTMLSFPLEAFLRFCGNHGLLQVEGRPQWRTVSGRSRTYVDSVLRAMGERLSLRPGAVALDRSADRPVVIDASGERSAYDAIVLACHADQALGLLDDADDMERGLLGAFGYQPNSAYLHTDPALMPQRRACWAAWNYLREGDDEDSVCVTYWLNRLQNLDVEQDIFVTLNPGRLPDPAHVVDVIEYTHPVFDRAAIDAQADLWSLQSHRDTWYCGAYFGYGFHEDGLQSGLAVAEDLGGVRRPWRVAGESGRISRHPVAKLPISMQAAE